VPIEPSISRDRIFRFGPFELSEPEGELRKNGVRLKLQEQPFRVLVELVANVGKVVSREELQQKLWPANTFVDFDVGLNTAIRKLRQALNDDTDDPHYIETLAKRGYRFVGSVTDISTKSMQQQLQNPPDGAQVSDGLSVSSLESVGAVNPVARSTRRWVWIAAAVVVVAIAAGLVFWLNRPPAVPIVEAVTQLTDDGEPKPYATKIVTDGVRIYFNEGTIGSLKIAQVAVTGGSVAAIPTTVVDPRIVGLAPEGSALLAISGGIGGVPIPLWQIPLPTGEPRRLGAIEVQDASFFPDGRILFARESDLYLAEKDGSNPRKLVSVEGVIRQPSISPDGQRLLFTVWSGLPLIPMSIVESKADGSGLHPIVNTSESGRVCCAQWSPDGKYILFQNRHEGRRDFWLLPMKAGFLQHIHHPIQLTNGPLSYAFPAQSRDGKQIFALGIKERGELVRFDVRENQFFPFLSGISAFNPTFSRDGNWVAYTSYPDHTLWRSRPDGSERLQLTYPPMQVYYPFISPDGKRVVYGNAKGEIYVIGMDGGPPQRIVEKDSSSANWSPDGNLLVFMNARDAAHPELQFLDLRTGKRSVVPGSQDLIGGHWVAENTLAATPRNQMKLMIFDVRTQHWSDLVPGKVPGNVVNWAHSPDYKYFYYTTGGAEPEALRIRLADHKVETIASLKDLPRALGPDGNTQISVAPDGSAIFTRDVGTQEVYALTLKWP
jgi:DNA-binding winged helix-turn-helix (wHTH) protein/dipeptidyl aminopeptidase/acylaminoacyl peptidase